MDKTAWRSTSLEWTEDVSPAGNFPYFIWNGQIVRPELAASHTLKNEAFHGPPLWKIALLYKMDRWMSLQQGFTHTLSEMDRWFYLSWQLPILQKIKTSMHSSEVQKKVAVAQIGKIEKLTALIDVVMSCIQ